MRGWKELFQDHILARGEMYFCDGAVLELHKTEQGISCCCRGGQRTMK